MSMNQCLLSWQDLVKVQSRHEVISDTRCGVCGEYSHVDSVRLRDRFVGCSHTVMALEDGLRV